MKRLCMRILMPWVAPLRNACRRAGMARSVAVLAGGTIAANAIAVLAAPLLTRLFTPEDFGAVGVYVAIVAILAVGAGGRYNLAIPLPERDDDAMDLLVLSLGIVLATAVAVGLAAWAVGPWVLDWTGAWSLRPYLWILPLAIVGSASYRVLCHWAIRRRAYGLIARTRLQQSMASAVVGVGMGAALTGPLGLLLSTLLAHTAGCRSLAQEVWAATGGRGPRTSLARLKRAAVTYRQFPMFSLWSGLLNAAAIMVAPILVAVSYGPEVTGLFVLAHRIVGLPMALIGQAVSDAFLGEASKAVRERPSDLPPLARRVTAKMLPLAAVLVVVAAASPFVFGTVFGARWQAAGTFAAILALSAAAQLVVSPISTVSAMLHRTDLDLYLDGARAVLTVAAFLVPAALGLSPLVAVGLYAAGRAGVYLGSFVLYRRLLARLVPRDGVLCPCAPTD